jgi:hypothetical protein
VYPEETIHIQQSKLSSDITIIRYNAHESTDMEFSVDLFPSGTKSYYLTVDKYYKNKL